MKRMQELEETLVNTVQILDAKTDGSDRIWETNNAHIQQHIMHSDISKFLQWDVIQYTMFVPADTPYIRKEYELLKASSQWKRWQSVLHECNVGAPTRSRIDPSTSPNLIHQVYSIYVMESYMKDYVHNLEMVFEFGGGYGCMCRLIHALGFTGQYILIDTPITSALQKYYLESCGVDGVWYVTDVEQMHEEKTLLDINAALIANWSLSEAPIELRNAVFQKLNGIKYMQVAFQKDFGNYDNMRYFQMLDIDHPSFAKTKLTFLQATPKNNYYMLGARW